MNQILTKSWENSHANLTLTDIYQLYKFWNFKRKNDNGYNYQLYYSSMEKINEDLEEIAKDFQELSEKRHDISYFQQMPFEMQTQEII